MKSSRHPRYARHRFPAEVISHAVWLYFRFPLSLRMVEEMLAARGILVSHETVRQWALKFGQGFANQIRAPASGSRRQMAPRRCVTNTSLKEEMWSCTRDEGWPLEVRSQVPASNPCKLRSSRATVVSVAAKGGTSPVRYDPERRAKANR